MIILNLSTMCPMTSIYYAKKDQLLIFLDMLIKKNLICNLSLQCTKVLSKLHAIKQCYTEYFLNCFLFKIKKFILFYLYRFVDCLHTFCGT